MEKTNQKNERIDSLLLDVYIKLQNRKNLLSYMIDLKINIQKILRQVYTIWSIQNLWKEIVIRGS